MPFELALRVVIAHCSGLFFKPLEGDAGLEIGFKFRHGFETIPRRYDLVVRIRFSDLALGVNYIDGKVTRSVEVDIGVECIAVESIGSPWRESSSGR